MRTPSGTLHVVDFKTSQIVSNIQTKDYWDDKRHWEIKNNIDTLEFKVFDNTEHAATLMQQNLVLKEVRDGRIVPYVITETEKDSNDRSVIAYASGEWIQLAKAGIITPQKVEGKTVNEFIDMALVGTKWKRGRTEYAGFHTMTIDEFIDPLKFLKDIASLFELEIQYRAEVVGSQIVSRYVDMVKKRGQETRKEVTLGKDLVGIKRVENSQNICTALLGFSKKEGEGFITITDINDGIPYLVDSDAFQRWNERGQHKFGFYTPETEGDITPKRLMTLMKTELAKRINSSISYDVQAQSIGRVFGLAHELINEGDTIRIKDTGFTPELYLEARAIAGDESFTDPSQDKYVFGDYREMTDPNEEMRKLYNRVLASLGNKANKELLEQLEKLAEEAKGTAEQAQKESQTAKKLAEKVQENLKNNTVNIIEAKNPPIDNLIVGKTLWRDISNGKPGILKVWNGKDWELLIPDVESVKKETLKQVNKDIQLTKEELNKKVEEAQSETNGQFKEVKNSLQEVSQTIKNVQNSQGEINKTVSEIKQTNEGFTKSIESLTKKDGEITEKLNTVEDTVEGTKKTITDIQSDTNGLKKTTTEIKEQAGKTSEKLESVEKKFDDMKFSGRNLLLSTGGTLKSDTGTNISNTVLKSFKFAPDIFEMIRGQEVALSITARTQAFSKGTPSPWIGMELSVTYEDNEQVWLPIRIEDKVAISQGWARYSAVVTIKNKAIKTGYLDSLIRNVKGMVELKEWQIEIGNKATEYRPAAEDQVTTDEFTKRTTEIEKSVDGIKENITKVEQNQTGFDKRVTTVEKNADSISQSVGKVQEIQTQQGKTLSEATSKIEQHSKALELQLKMKDVEDYVGGIGNQTVLRNVLWKNDTKYWQLTSNATRDTQVTYKGCNSLSVITTGNASNLYKGASHDYINAGPGWNYVFSAYFYTDNKASIDAGAAIELQCYDVNNKMIKSYLQEITISQGTWIRTHVAGLLIEGTKKVKVLFWVRKNGRLWMAQPMLQIGDKPSSFMENPVDIVDKDKIMEELADKIATEPYNKKVTELERGISATAEGVEITSKKQEKFINETYAAYVKETGSKLKVLDEGILAEVKKGNIIAAINFSSEKLEIDVSKVAINADTMVKWLTAKGIDTNVINVNGDKITIDKNGVTVKMLDFLFEDEWGTKTTVIPKRNLIADHDFSSVPKLNIGNPNYQGFGAGYGLPWKVQGNGVVIENNTFIFNYEQMVNAVRVDTYNYPETKVQNGIHPGNSYTLSAHYRTAQINSVRTTAKPRLQVCFVTPLDEVSYKIWHEIYKDFPEPSTFYGEIRRYNFTFTVPNNYNPQEHMIVVKVTAANAQVSAGRAVCVSGITLVSGNYACMYNWDRAAAERADGLQPFNKIAIGGVNNNIGPAAHGQTFDISTEKDVFINQPILTQGINLGRNKMGQAGSIRFFDGGQGYGFYFMGMGGQWYKLPNV
ncbi:phage tail spike protein [Bacillus thuringiensis]|uniref:phage tail spike protein n=1 Tax=Bacillus thuringiensis TaxID=1428 RepID=UPI001298B536|nr:phage tail spike protein [Bacillus thuringiensis]MEB8929844.1 phage tail spike protein [Bacillus cereus]MCR6786203.1 phage tail protein [Bacillus thuringiensis]MCR6826373.1 phage tail protein [Bacillus thuringiensis]MCR6832332.1 phage tail protein [Bacillus thuringiensis]MEB9324102.1 phage tail spike protein [Bacillus cereus]